MKLTALIILASCSSATAVTISKFSMATAGTLMRNNQGLLRLVLNIMLAVLMISTVRSIQADSWQYALGGLFGGLIVGGILLRGLLAVIPGIRNSDFLTSVIPMSIFFLTFIVSLF